MDKQTEHRHSPSSCYDNVSDEQYNLEQIWQKTQECWTGSVADEFQNQVIIPLNNVLIQLSNTLAQYSE